jgi:hypothetical protein
MLVTDVLDRSRLSRVIDARLGRPGGPEGSAVDVRIDLLITDVGLPGGINGRQVADAARTTRPS